MEALKPDYGALALIACVLIMTGLTMEWFRQYRTQLNTADIDELVADKLMQSKTEYVILEYKGRKIQMTKYEAEFVWPKMTAEQKRLATQPVKPKDMQRVTGPDGETYLTNKVGTSKIAKERDRRKRVIENSVPLAKRRGK